MYYFIDNRIINVMNLSFASSVAKLLKHRGKDKLCKLLGW